MIVRVKDPDGSIRDAEPGERFCWRSGRVYIQGPKGQVLRERLETKLKSKSQQRRKERRAARFAAEFGK